MVTYVKGNLLDSDCDVICHQVNCQGVMRSGIAKQIRERWPKVYETYRNRYDRQLRSLSPLDSLLGIVDMVHIGNNKWVFNMYAQHRYGYDGKRYTSYEAFADCLEQIRYRTMPEETIGFPKNIGCGLGGGNWNVISALIEEFLGDRNVYIYEL